MVKLQKEYLKKLVQGYSGDITMKKLLYRYYKNIRHNTRLLLESNDVINEIYLKNKNRVLINKFGKCKINDKKIVFSNYMGRGYGCNCKYLAEELLRQNNDYDLVWVINPNEDVSIFPKGIRVVDYTSEDALYELMTAKFWISNYHLSYFIKKGLIKRDEQIYIQMWHGSFGIKKIERHAVAKMESKMWLKVAMLNSRMTSYWISNSNFETNVYKNAFWDVENIKLLGHPRNDIFFKDNTLLENKVLAKYNGDKKKNIVLYMTTFREDNRLDCYNIDVEKLCNKLKEKFGGDWVLLIRLHPRIVKLKEQFFASVDNEHVYDVTFYDDVQELLAVADVMISDYSSCIFDYLLTFKPAFIYATDIEEYNKERGFYYSLYDTPFSIAKNNGELLDAIDKFNEEQYKTKVKEFLDEKGSVEDGKAAEKIVEFIGRL